MFVGVFLNCIIILFFMFVVVLVCFVLVMSCCCYFVGLLFVSEGVLLELGLLFVIVIFGKILGVLEEVLLLGLLVMMGILWLNMKLKLLINGCI